MRRRLVRAMLVWATLSVVGAVVLALPDDGPRIFALSETHGPSATDLAGIVLLLLGWIVFLSALWRARSAVRVPSRPMAVTAAAAAGVLVWSVLTDSGLWWLVAASVLLGIQIRVGLSAAGALERRGAAGGG